MTLNSHFEQRKNDIEEFYKLLHFIMEVEPHLNKPIVNIVTNKRLLISQEMQCIMKAQFLIVLYNFVESTVCDCLNSFYDAILDEHLTFSSLSPKMKNMWRSYMKRKSNPDKDKTDAELASMSIAFEELAVNISGSLDLRKIIDVFDKHGCILDVRKKELYGESFLTVKNRRNLLAHGNTSFSVCGSNFILDDLKRIKEHIIEYMQDVVTSSNSYIDNKLYKI